ncbi:hypothetical protein PHBOTO_000621, partial [Pseudozyma hubeiensis]
TDNHAAQLEVRTPAAGFGPSRSEQSQAKQSKAKQKQSAARLSVFTRTAPKLAGEGFGYHLACAMLRPKGLQATLLYTVCAWRLHQNFEWRKWAANSIQRGHVGMGRLHLLSASNAAAFAKESEAESFAFGGKGGTAQQQTCQTQQMSAIQSDSTPH